jgi:hypothetical protein
MCGNYRLDEKRKAEVRKLQMTALRVIDMTDEMKLTTNQLNQNKERVMELHEKIVFLSQKFKSDCEDFCEFFDLDAMKCKQANQENPPS